MVSDKEFYDEFRKSVLGSSFLDNDETSNRISFMLFQFERDVNKCPVCEQNCLQNFS